MYLRTGAGLAEGKWTRRWENVGVATMSAMYPAVLGQGGKGECWAMGWEWSDIDTPEIPRVRRSECAGSEGYGGTRYLRKQTGRMAGGIQSSP